MWFALQRAVEKLPDCSIYTEDPMTIFGFAGKHVKIIHHPPHCDLPIFNGDDSPAPKLKKVKNCPTCSYVRPKAHSRCSKLQAVQSSEGGENGKSSNAIAMVTVPIDMK